MEDYVARGSSSSQAASSETQAAAATPARPEKSNPAKNTEEQENSVDDVGYIQDEFQCVWQSYSGTLTAGSKALRFHGSFFLFDKTLLLPWDNIYKVVHVAAGDGSSGDVVEIILADETVHAFRKLRAPDKVWLLLMTLHNDALLGRNIQHQQKQQTPFSHSKSPATPGDAEGGGSDALLSTPPPSRQMRRRNSDPASASAPSAPSPEQKEPEFQVTVTSTPNAAIPPSSSKKQARPVISAMTSFAEEINANVIEQAIGGAGQMLLQPMHCTYDGTTGRLYTGTAALVFTGKRFFWEHVLVTVPWSSLRRIRAAAVMGAREEEKQQQQQIEESGNGPTTGGEDTQNNSTPVSSGLILETKLAAVRIDGGSDHTITSFTFADMESVDQIVVRLVQMLNENLQEQPTDRQQQQQQRRQSQTMSPTLRSARRRQTLQRMNSDPLLQSSQIKFDFALVLEDEANDDYVSPSVEMVCKAESQQQQLVQKEEIEGPDSDTCWKTVLASPKEVYTKKVVDNYILLDCSLDTFYETFWVNDAPHSLGRFLQGCGDFDLSVTEWSADTANSTQQTRVVRFTHPVHAPMAPPEAAARKEQTLQRFGTAGLLIQTQTFVDGVPMADCFYVADRICVEPVAVKDATDRPAVSVTMEFGLTFVKSTMFKGIITKKTSSEYVEFFEALAQYMSDALTEPEAVVVATEEEGEPSTTAATEDVEAILLANESKPAEAKPYWSSWADRIRSGVTIECVLLLGVLLLQGWILCELRGLQQSVRLLEESAAVAAASAQDVGGGGTCASSIKID